MNKRHRLSMIGILCSAALLVAGIGHAETTVLTFEGVGNGAHVNDFYNGGTDSEGNSGTNYGIGFSDTSLGLIDGDAGGSGNFANEPSPDTVLFFLSGGAATMNVAAGFDTGFSFYYSANATDTFVNVWSGLNGTGDLLTTLNLNANYNANNCTGDPTGIYCNWDPIGVLFAGIAHSVDFGGTANYVAFDNITLGSDIPGNGSTPVPEPGTLAMFGLGLLLVGGAAWKKRRRLS
ncbi:MAG TPA: PEP-CTERM sorting domain-containing protein [Rhodanobacteraceae bacterium]|jgi:hypothetical protein|nr:PEP-CTERM sorting domain-containing protein [Rhodanobacteraceae bacterium]